MEDVIIKSSKIHGRGVFADRDFKKGEKIIELGSCSKIIKKEEYDSLEDNEKVFVSELKKGEYVLYFAPARFINHSSNPNSKIEKNYQTALKNIKSGEEITTDYRLENVSIEGFDKEIAK